MHRLKKTHDNKIRRWRKGRRNAVDEIEVEEQETETRNRNWIIQITNEKIRINSEVAEKGEER